MVDFKKLMEQPPMTEEAREQLWKDWYDGLSKSERKIVDTQCEKIGEAP